jgi:aspartate aminotransferase
LLVNGVSKTYAMTGWRLGYGAGPEALIGAMTAVQSQATSGAGSISQAAALAALTGDQSFVQRANVSYTERRNILVDHLSKITGIDVVAPDGAFFVFASCAGLIGKVTPAGKLLRSDVEFVEYLLESEGVAVVDGSSFGLSPYFRLSLAAATTSISDACGRIARACKGLQLPRQEVARANRLSP